jgi:hypothetical protein
MKKSRPQGTFGKVIRELKPRFVMETQANCA